MKASKPQWLIDAKEAINKFKETKYGSMNSSEFRKQEGFKIGGAQRGAKNKGIKKSSTKKYIEASLNRPIDHNKKISNSLIGIPLTEKRRNNISEAGKRRKVCPYCNSFESNVSNTNRHMNNCQSRPN